MLLFPSSKGLKRVVIIGGGFGGIELARRLNDKMYQVILIDKNNYHTFQPLLYQVATGGLEPDSIAYPIRKIFSGRKHFIFRMAEVQSVDHTKKLIGTNIGTINYDILVIATGSTTNFFGNAEFEKNAMSLKSVTDALDLRSLILQNFEKLLTVESTEEKEKYHNIVIVGGGPTGVEIAGAMAELKKHVLPHDYPELNINDLVIHLVESSKVILSSMAGKSSAKAKIFLEHLGVKLWLNSAVASYKDQCVFFKNGESIPCNTLIWTAGVKGNIVTGFDESVITRSNRMKVDTFNRLTGYDSIYIIGDLAAMPNNGNDAHPMVAPVAIQQAKMLARNLNLEDSRSWKKFRYNDAGSMATIGRNKAVAEISGIKLQGILAWFVWMFVHLMSIVGFRNRLVVLVNWIWSYFSYDRAIRLIIRPFTRKNG